MRVLVVGATGLLGNTLYRVLSEQSDWTVLGTVRSEGAKGFFVPELSNGLVAVRDLTSLDELKRLFSACKPDVVINCVALRRTEALQLDPALNIYAILPMRLAHLCQLSGARMVQISTDGVFSGARGRYTEEDLPDADDIYGRTKYLGEVQQPRGITLRTSMIGHELNSQNGRSLLEWFLAQRDECRCYTRAVFSGLPAVELSQLIRDFVLPRADLSGLYHIAAAPISKFDLLKLVAVEYGKVIRIIPDDSVAMDRSLIADRFNAATGYNPSAWPEMIRVMRSYRFGLAGTN